MTDSHDKTFGWVKNYRGIQVTELDYMPTADGYRKTYGTETRHESLSEALRSLAMVELPAGITVVQMGTKVMTTIRPKAVGYHRYETTRSWEDPDMALVQTFVRTAECFRSQRWRSHRESVWGPKLADIFPPERAALIYLSAEEESDFAGLKKLSIQDLLALYELKLTGQLRPEEMQALVA